MTLEQAIFVFLVRLPPARVDRDAPIEARKAQMYPVAVAIAHAVRSSMEAAEELAVGEHETKFASLVLTGHCELMPEMTCDHGRARGFGQQHRRACPRVWALPDGTFESIHEQARCAIALLRYHAGRHIAPTPLRSAFTGYAGRSWPDWEDAFWFERRTYQITTEIERLKRLPYPDDGLPEGAEAER